MATSTIPDGSTEGWRDKKRYLWLIGLVVPSLAFVAFAAYALTGWGVWFWIGPVVILVAVPAIDLVAGLDRSNPPDDMIAALEKDKYYRWITYFFLPIQYVGFVMAMYAVSGGNPASWVIDHVGLTPWFTAHADPRFTGEIDLNLVDRIGLAISIGCIGGIGINTAHELGHKKERNERWLSKIALAQSFYGHFYIEHNRGHHVRVATPEDPASARVGESFYQFWPRTVLGSLRSAWNLEKRRIARRRRHPFRISNDVLNAWLMSAVLWGAMIVLFGVGVLPFLMIQAVVGFSLLEVVNYMEHYGMLRQKVGVPGKERYERVDPSHSWNSNNIATNVLLYHLQRHSDHHANPTRRYQTLRDFEESPVLPTGYAGMIVLAAVPAVWRRVMDPRVLAHFDGDITRANINPRNRDKILASYPPTAAPPQGADPSEAHPRSEAGEGARAVSAAPQQGADPSEAHRRSEAGEGVLRRVGDPVPAGEPKTAEGGGPQPQRVGSEPQPQKPQPHNPHPQPDEILAAGCPGCDYVYDVTTGDEHEGFAAGTSWADIPDTWCCPDCGVREKVDFVPVAPVDA